MNMRAQRVSRAFMITARRGERGQGAPESEKTVSGQLIQ